jgi:DNA-binding transcriptional LysR family regulator
VESRRIRHFVVLAETLNFSRAAARLHIAQPALSVSIQKLETSFGAKLFERTSVGVVLTPSGCAALVEAKRFLQVEERMLLSVRDIISGATGRIRIGFVGSATHRLIPAIVPAFRALYPGVELVLQDMVSTQITRLLDEELLDVGLVRTPLIQSTDLELVTLQRDRFVVALSKKHPLVEHSTLSIAQLAGQPLIMYSASTAPGLRASVMAVCQAAGFLPDVAQEAAQMPTVLALVESGLGVALVPEVMRGYREHVLVYKDVADLTASGVTTIALARKRANSNPAAQRFVEVSVGVLDNP